jgi:hypothetical protein
VVDAGNRNIQIFGIDTDGDGVPDHKDNSPTFANPDSEVVVQDLHGRLDIELASITKACACSGGMAL